MLDFSPRLIGEIGQGRGTVGIDKVFLYAITLGIDMNPMSRKITSFLLLALESKSCPHMVTSRYSCWHTSS